MTNELQQRAEDRRVHGDAVEVDAPLQHRLGGEAGRRPRGRRSRRQPRGLPTRASTRERCWRTLRTPWPWSITTVSPESASGPAKSTVPAAGSADRGADRAPRSRARGGARPAARRSGSRRRLTPVYVRNSPKPLPVAPTGGRSRPGAGFGDSVRSTASRRRPSWRRLGPAEARPLVLRQEDVPRPILPRSDRDRDRRHAARPGGRRSRRRAWRGPPRRRRRPARAPAARPAPSRSGARRPSRSAQAAPRRPAASREPDHDDATGKGLRRVHAEGHAPRRAGRSPGAAP